MAKILFAWELGGGNGHLGPFYSIAKHLLAAGHSLTLAVRDQDRATKLFHGLNVELVQAPLWPKSTQVRIKEPSNYAQVLLNVGFGEQNTCARILSQWRAIEDDVDPQLIIADHSPGMLFSARHQRQVVVIGNGFFVPRTASPMPSLAIGHSINNSAQFAESSLQGEVELLQTLNRVRSGLQLRELAYIGDVFDKVHASFLTTFAELDHYMGRQNAKYRGGLSYDGFGGETVTWPSGIGPRIFAYLKWSRGLGHLLDAIGQSGCPTLIVADGMEIDPLQRLARPNMRFSDRPLPIQHVADECDFAILNATHGATCSLLLTGKPIVQIPHNLEQAITAYRTESLGAAVGAQKDDGLAIVAAFQAVRFDPQYAINAQAFAARYQDFDAKEAANQIAQDVCQLIG
jgi:hypothetical protein